MAKHVKPTKEELEKNALQAAKEAEEMIEAEKEEEKEKADEVIEQEETKEEEGEQEETQEEVVEQEEIKEEEGEKEESSEEIQPDYKKKFIESSREALVIVSKNKKLNEAIDKASQVDEPTEDELRVEYPEFDDMTETEKKLAKDSLVNKKRFSMIHEANKESKDIEAWNGKVDEFIGDPKTLADNPDLEGKQDEFRIFAMKPSRRGIDFEDLVRSFLYDATTKIGKNKGKMFEVGTSGANSKLKPKSGKITLEQTRALRKTNYAKYVEYVKSGKIDVESLK